MCPGPALSSEVQAHVSKCLLGIFTCWYISILNETPVPPPLHTHFTPEFPILVNGITIGPAFLFLILHAKCISKFCPFCFYGASRICFLSFPAPHRCQHPTSAVSSSLTGLFASSPVPTPIHPPQWLPVVLDCHSDSFLSLPIGPVSSVLRPTLQPNPTHLLLPAY